MQNLVLTFNIIAPLLCYMLLGAFLRHVHGDHVAGLKAYPVGNSLAVHLDGAGPSQLGHET